MSQRKQTCASAFAAIWLWIGFSGAAIAHPHVWVTYEATVLYENGTMTGIDHVWTFDDMYTAMAIQGLDKNGDGTYTREELAELAQINIDGLKDFEYFTHAKLGKTDLKFAPPTGQWLENTNGILRLHFRLPLAQPVLIEAEGFTFSIHDPSYFIAFEPEKTDAIRLAAGAPAGCTAALLDSASDPNSLEAKKLGEAFFQQLGGANYGFGMAKAVSVTCKKS